MKEEIEKVLKKKIEEATQEELAEAKWFLDGCELMSKKKDKMFEEFIKRLKENVEGRWTKDKINWYEFVEVIDKLVKEFKEKRK